MKNETFQELLLCVKEGGSMLRSLNHTLPSLLEEIPVQYHADVFPLLAMDDQALQQELRQVFSSERWVMYETLFDVRPKKVCALDGRGGTLVRGVTVRRRYCDVSPELCRRPAQPARSCASDT